MNVKSLVVGKRYFYDEGNGAGERCVAKVISINTDTKTVTFLDEHEDFEWDSPFDKIEDTVKYQI